MSDGPGVYLLPGSFSLKPNKPQIIFHKNVILSIDIRGCVLFSGEVNVTSGASTH